MITPFELPYQEQTLLVYAHIVKRQEVFRIAFPDGRQPLILTRAVAAEAFGFWTSIPEGRQEEAEVVGRILDEHFKNTN